MYKNLLNLPVSVVSFLSCSGIALHISIVYEESNVGNCITKQGIASLVKENVGVYASTDPDTIPEDVPITIVGIPDLKVTIIINDPVKCYYYTLLFGDKYRVKIATRNASISGIQNLRDLSDYPSYSTRKQVCWGMIYRSAEIDSLECYSRRELRSLGIKTFIDLRAPSETGRQPPLQKKFDVVRISPATRDMGNILKGIREEKIKSDTAYRMVEQTNRDLVDKYITEYQQIFDILLDKNSYPVVVHYSFDKGRTGIVSALMSAVLGINEDMIMKDYQLSNDCFNIPSVSKDIYQLPVRSQEVITTLFSAHEDFLNVAKEEAERRYGDIDSYLQKGIGLNKDEIKRLRSILFSD